MLTDGTKDMTDGCGGLGGATMAAEADARMKGIQFCAEQRYLHNGLGLGVG
jgi:hypothetical protein